MISTLDIIIVNWNSGQQLRECLQSIVAASETSQCLLRVVVVDNASTDGSLDGLENAPLPLTIIRNGQNCGFAAACNQGAKCSSAEYLLFLNPDTRLMENSLSKPLAFMDQPNSRHIGILGIQLLDEKGRVSRRVCARFPSPANFLVKTLGLDRLFPRFFPKIVMDEWHHRESREVDSTTGAFFLVRRSLFEELQGFDERFFVYLEDVDFSLRARRAGWANYYLAEAQAFHKEHGTSEKAKAARIFYWLRSRIVYGYKHFGWSRATALLLATLFVEPVARLVLSVAHCSGQEAIDSVRGIFRLWISLPSLYASLKQVG